MVIVQSGADEQLTDKGIGYVPTCIEAFDFFAERSSRSPVRVETTEMVKENFIGTRIAKRKLIRKEKTEHSFGKQSFWSASVERLTNFIE